MTLFDLAKRNIKGNIKNYLVYFISMLLSVVIYYTFVSLQYSQEISIKIESSDSMLSIFLIASIMLLLFISIFTLYSNNFFNRKRKKEVGLYALLGLPRKNIGKMLFYENLIMSAIVVVAGILIGTFFSKLFSMILLKLLRLPVNVGMVFSIKAIINTLVVFTIITIFTSIQNYRIIYRFRLVELFRADQEGEQEPKASFIAAILAILLIGVGYGAASQSLATNNMIIRNLLLMSGGIIAGTVLLFSSLVVVLLSQLKKNKKQYYKGMNLVSISNLIYRIKGNARTLSIISILSAAALCAFSVGLGMYYGYGEVARLTSPFSYMHIAQNDEYNKNVERIIHEDDEHLVKAQLTIPVIKVKGDASSSEILSDKNKTADENPIKVISVDYYNQAAGVLNIPQLKQVKENEAIAIRPMYTDYEYSDYAGESIIVQLPKGDLKLEFVGMTAERVINWSYPDIMIVVNDSVYERISDQILPINYIGYLVEAHESTKETANTLAPLNTPESQLSNFYTEYRLGIEGAAFNVFILGFLGLVFVAATGSIIYFKQLTEATSDRSRYEILMKIGVNKKEIHNSILKQNAFIFLLPLIVGSAHYIAILNLLSRLFSSMAGLNLAAPIFICVIVFIMIYATYYIMTVNTISKMVIGESTSIIKIAVTLIIIGLIALLVLFVLSDTPKTSEEQYKGEKIQLMLPKPTGKYKIGTTEMHLVDENREDPWVKKANRELMISLWYPTKEEGNKKAVYMKPNAAKVYDENEIPTIGVDTGLIDISGISTNAWENAPILIGESRWPVILYSPGAGVPRNFGTSLVEELVSHGYVVITVDHTYDASVVEFPSGRVLTQKLPRFNADTVLKLIDVRVDDMKFVLDELAGIKLPVGFDKAIDLSKIGIFGHSAGGATAAQLMYEDNRVGAGIDMDGTMGYMPDYPLEVAKYGLNKPFMLMNGGYNDKGEVDSHLTELDKISFWNNSTGWKMDIAIPNGAHFTFTDYLVLLPQLGRKTSISQQVIQKSIGNINSNEILEAERDYISAFFNLHLKDIPQDLLETTNSFYTDIRILE